jgi:hypothetical protein
VTDTAVVYGIAPNSAKYGSELTLAVADSMAREIDRSQFPPTFELDLVPGSYTLTAGLYGASELGSIALTLLKRLSPLPPFSATARDRPFDVSVGVMAPGLHSARQNARTAQGLAQASRGLALDSARQQLSVAVGLMEAAISTDSVRAVTAEQLNSVCWEGALADLADHVLRICRLAVEKAPSDPNIIDSRGLARALTGDRAHAIRDFQVFIDSNVSDSAERVIREEWIKRLHEGNLTVTEARETLGRDSVSSQTHP